MEMLKIDDNRRWTFVLPLEGSRPEDLLYAARARVSTRASVIFGESILGCEVAKILPRHSTRRRAARASRNEGVHFEPYQEARPGCRGALRDDVPEPDGGVDPEGETGGPLGPLAP